MDVALGKKAHNSSHVQGVYKEVQIHGPVQLNKHVECLVVNAMHKNNQSTIKDANEFCEKNGCWWAWSDDPWYKKRKVAAKQRVLIHSADQVVQGGVSLADFRNDHSNTNDRRKRWWFW